ncbi:TetR/AcrR family transcriptional regulator [Lactococcus garvieae]|nr:TetR/AcrR family transcriptional regulator [Lactococcus garvieae]
MPRGTREKIVNAFFRCANKHPDIHHFTIAEIAEEAGVSRQAIQRKHYRTVEELILDIRRQVNDKVKKELDFHYPKEGISPYHVFAMHILPVIYEYRDWLKVLCTTCMDPHWMNFIETQYKEWFAPYLVEDVSKTGFSKEFVKNFIVKEVLSIVASWLSEDLPEPPVSFSRKFLLLTLTSEELFIAPQYHYKAPVICKK